MRYGPTYPGDAYWSWNPKETLALVTFLIYALPLHGGVSFLRAPRRYHVYMLLAILSVAATSFGVNLFRSLHAYARLLTFFAYLTDF